MSGKKNIINKNKVISQKKNEDKSCKPEVYNEKTIVNRFLTSKSGFPFLDSFQGKSSDIPKTAKQVIHRIDEIIDFYTTWTQNFPVRKNLKVSKYEFLKSVEAFCAKNNF